MPACAAACRPARAVIRVVLAAGLATGLLAATGVAARAASSPAPPPTAATAPPGPAAPVPSPAALENLSGYVPADSCDATPKPGVRQLAALLQAFYPGTGSAGIASTCAAERTVSEHTEGRAFDWAASVSNPVQRAQVLAFLAWVLAPDAAGHPAAMARRLGIMYMIWDGRIIGLYNLSAGWRPYACSGVTGCHQDHVHLSLSWAGAEGVTSFWTGLVAADDFGPCRGPGQMFAMPYSGANSSRCPDWSALPAGSPVIAAIRAAHTQILATGSAGAAVRTLQLAMGGLSPDGTYGSRSVDLVETFQARRGLPVTGVVDAATWDSLLRYVTAGTQQLTPSTAAGSVPPTALSDGADASSPPAGGGAPSPSAPAPSRRWTAWLHSAHPGWAAPPPVVRPGGPAAVPGPVASALTEFRDVVLTAGAAPGPAVRALQQALRLPLTGSYDAVTIAAVRSVQRAHGLPVDGAVGPMTWRALGA